jgi:SAM-dependent methyltransferase
VLDIGCGIGANLLLFAAEGGADVHGVDGMAASATALGPSQYTRHDLTRPLDLGRRFDLVMCLEVAEHLPPGHDETLLDSIARHAGGTILFSAAEPGQPGHGHVNTQKLSAWLAKWRARGWLPELAESLGVRGMATLSWFRRNPVLLRRAADVAQDGTTRLEAIAARPFTWWGQAPGIRATLLDDAAPDPATGYG